MDAAGMAIGASLSSKINIDVYDNVDAAGNPIRVQTVKSQGDPRWLEDVVLDPTGTVALVAGIWFMLEIITMLLNEKRRALHDLIAGTVVVRTQIDAGQSAPQPEDTP